MRVLHSKTTTMVFKILGIERTYDTGNFRYAMVKPRQLFVTQSQVLAKKVEEYYAKLHQSHATAHLSPAELQEMASTNPTRRERMVDEDEEIFYTTTLPRRFGALEDSHFPLFLTYNHVSYQRILCDCGASVDISFVACSRTSSVTSSSKRRLTHTRYLSSETS